MSRASEDFPLHIEWDKTGTEVTSDWGHDYGINKGWVSSLLNDH